jgi:RNA-directed DNA polymerase
MLFEKNVKQNIRALHWELKNRTYQHSPYISFYIKDPKLRHINKATVRDRVLHHAVFVILYRVFDRLFIFDSYSSRNEKGTHRAVHRLNQFANKVSKNNTRTCFILKCDIKKFFDSIDQEILIGLIKKQIYDENTILLLQVIINSFKKGIPLGNVTSQIFANIYLNELDQFIKRTLKIKYYIRYCDDFIILHNDQKCLITVIPKINNFLENNLKLSLHPDKITIRKYHQGIDFLGYVSFPYHKVLRTKTKHRIFKKIEFKIEEFKKDNLSEKSFNQTLQSYFGILKHCNSYKLGTKIIHFLWRYTH